MQQYQNMERKFCVNCGKPLTPGSKFCASCGKPVPAASPNSGYPAPVRNQNPSGYNATPMGSGRPSGNQPNYGNYPPQQYPAPVQTPRPRTGEIVTRKVFRREYAPKKFHKDLRTASIILYCLIGFQTLMGILINPVLLGDAILYIGLTLGMHLGKNKGCAIAILVTSCCFTLLTFFSTGRLQGYAWIFAGILAVKVFADVDKAYDAQFGYGRK